MSVVNTGNVQAESLRLFMGMLGYVPARWNGGFVTENPRLAGNRTLSTATAIKLHNLTGDEWVESEEAPGWYLPAGFNLRIAITAYGVNMLQASKIVQHIKFQPKRTATNGLSLPKDENVHLVRFVDQRYAPLFGLSA